MRARIVLDSNAPTASIEIVLRKPLEDYDLVQVQAETPRDVDPTLASQGFKDLIDDVRGILEGELSASSVTIVQLTGAICPDGGVHRPGIWLVLEERNAANKEMSPQARAKVESAVQALQSGLGIS